MLARGLQPVNVAIPSTHLVGRGFVGVVVNDFGSLRIRDCHFPSAVDFRGKG
jgi:hypothetical protein